MMPTPRENKINTDIIIALSTIPYLKYHITLNRKAPQFHPPLLNPFFMFFPPYDLSCIIVAPNTYLFYQKRTTNSLDFPNIITVYFCKNRQDTLFCSPKHVAFNNFRLVPFSCCFPLHMVSHGFTMYIYSAGDPLFYVKNIHQIPYIIIVYFDKKKQIIPFNVSIGLICCQFNLFYINIIPLYVTLFNYLPCLTSQL